MDQRAKVIIGALVVVIAILAAGLVAVVATDDGDDAMDAGMAGAGMTGGDSYVGMMQAMGDMDSDAMLAHMREVLGEDGYGRMLEHWRNHRAGGPMTGDAGVDEMMHQMMDSIMQRMPADRDHMFPLPAASPTATPAR